MRSKNMLISAADAREAEAIAEEYRFCGREAEVDRRTNTVTVFALPRQYKAKSVREARMKKTGERSQEAWETKYAPYS